MTSQEFAQEWNEVFPDSRIHPNELANPTDGFLVNALLTLLRSISINISISEFDPASHDLETIRKNKLVLFQYVNDMYRSLHNKKFHYFDFILPTPKKTLNLLQTLLNYVLYYNMVKDETAADTMTAINQYRELLDRKAHLQKEREKNKIQVQHGQKTLETLSNQLEELNQQVVEEKKNPIVREFEENTQNKTKLTQKLAGLKVQVAELATQCINEDDYVEMKSSVFEIQEALSEKQEALEKLTTNHESLCMEIASLESKISLLEGVSEIIPDGKTIAPGKLNEKKEELLRTMIIYEENKKKVQELCTQLEKRQQELDELSRKQAKLHEGWAEKLVPMEKLEDTLSEQFKTAQEGAERMKLKVEQSKQDIKFMQENAKIGLNLIRKSFIADVELNDENSPKNY